MTHDLLVLRWDDVACTFTLQLRKPSDKEPSHVEHVAFASDEEVAFASDEEDAYASDEEDAYAVAAIAAIAVKPSVTRDRARLALQSLALKLAEVDCDRAASMAIVGEGLSWPFRAIEVEQLARTVVALAREAGEAPAAPILEPTVIPSVTIAERPPTPRYGDRMRLELAFDALESALALRSYVGPTTKPSSYHRPSRSGLIDPPLAVVDPLTHDEGEG